MSKGLSFDIQITQEDFTLSAAADIPLNGITALSGPSGSGKTTLLRAIAGLEPVKTGYVHFAEEDWTKAPFHHRGIGYVFQDARLFPHLDVAGNLSYGATRREVPDDMVQAVVDALDLRPLLARKTTTLSGGETRRVALGRALASGPRILLLDEPLTGLDRARKFELMPYIAQAVAAFDVPAIYVTHSASEIGFLADRVLHIEAGQLVSWAGAPPRLIGQVVNVAPGQVDLAIADKRLWMQGQGTIGEVWALPLGQDYVISGNPLGITNAALTLEARVVALDPGIGQIQLEISGQFVALNWQSAESDYPKPEDRVFISLPKIAARPVQSDPTQFDS